MNHSPTFQWLLVASAALALSACGGGGNGVTDAIIGGTVSGLSAGSTVVLEDGMGTRLSVAGSASFDFPDLLAPSAPYSVDVLTQPQGATCSVLNGSGTVDSNGDAVNNVAVTCQPGTTVSGTVGGLAAGATVTLTDGTSTLPLAANGSFAFTDLFTTGAPYTVSVATQPSGQVCAVTNGTGTIDASGDVVGNVAVACTAAPALGGSVVGLAPNASVTLSDGVGTVVLSANGNFGFGDSFAPFAPYQVSVVAQPAGQTCSLANASGTFDSNADAVSNVAVNCTTNGAVGGTVVGLAANASVTLSDGNTTQVVTANGSYAFTDLYAAGAPYNVSVQVQPGGQTCTVVGGSGALDANDDAVTTVSITCG